MKRLLSAVALFCAAYAAPALSEEPFVDEMNDDPAYVTEDDMETEEDALAPNGNKAQYNLWVCTAVRRGYLGFNPQMYFGGSQVFGAGSGFGQQARYQAFNQAMNQCGGQYYCVADCYVHRFQM